MLPKGMAENRASGAPPDIMMMGLRSFGTGIGGVETHVRELATELDSLGVGLEVIVRSQYQEASGNLDGILITRIWSPRHVAMETIVHSLLAVFYAAIRRPKVLHIHAVGPSLMVPLARLFGLRVVTTHHGEDYNRDKWGRAARTMLRLGELFQAKFSNFRICVSSNLSERLTGTYGTKFNYIPNGVRPMTGSIDQNVLHKYGLSPGRYIVSVGRFVMEKRQIDLIEAFISLESMDSDFKLALIGDSTHESNYSKKVKELSAAHRNIILTGFLSGDELKSVFGNAGLFCMPSSHEGLPIALLESLALRRHVLVSDIDANQEIGLPEQCYHRVGDVAHLAKKLQGFISNPESYVVPDWDTILLPYRWEQIAGETLDAYGTISSVTGHR